MWLILAFEPDMMYKVYYIYYHRQKLIILEGLFKWSLTFVKLFEQLLKCKIKVVAHQGKIVLLTTVYSALSRMPDQSKRYLKEEDRDRIAKTIPPILVSAVEILANKDLNYIEGQERIIEIQRVLD